MRTEDKCLVETRSQYKSSSINLPEVHGVDKAINPHVRPEKQTLKPITVTPETKNPTWKKPKLRQGRAGLRRKVKVVTPPQSIKPVPVMPKLEKQKTETTTQPQVTVGSKPQVDHIPVIQTTSKQLLKPKMLTKEVPPYPDPRKRSSPRLPDLQEDQRTLMDSGIDINTDFEDNSPYQEAIISESYQRTDKSCVQEPPELGDLLDTGKFIQNFLPKQMDIDNFLEIIQKKY